jgi:hypothetical protein
MPKGIPNKKPPVALGNVHQAIIYLRAADRAIATKPIKTLTEAEVYGHLAYVCLTEKP